VNVSKITKSVFSDLLMLTRVIVRIRPPHAAAAAIDQYLLTAGPTAANLQTDGHRTVS